MSLSPEERHKIYLEEKARTEVYPPVAPVGVGPRPGTITFTLSKKVLVAVLTLVGLAAFIYHRVNTKNVDSPTQSPALAQPQAEAGGGKDRSGGEPDDLNTLLDRISGEEGAGADAILKNASAVNTQITYAHLKKNAGRYVGEPWALQGKVLQIFEHDGVTEARVGFGSWNNDVVYVVGRFTTDFIDNDRVYVVGYLAGDYSYTSQAGWKITIPLLAARAMLKQDELQRLQAEARRGTEAEQKPAAASSGEAHKARPAADSLQRRRAEARRLLNQ